MDVWQKISEIYGHNPLEAKFASGPVGRQSLDEQQLTNPDVGIDPVVGKRRGTTPITASQAQARAAQAQTAMDVALGFAGGTNTPIRAWHGTPHVWSPAPGKPLGAPDPTKIGTGEGNASYGVAPGGYWAEDRRLGELYRNALSPSDFFVGGKRLDAFNPEHRIAILNETYSGDMGNIAAKLNKDIGDYQAALNHAPDQPSLRRELEALQEAKKQLLTASSLPKLERRPLGGALYEANLHANPNRLLELDVNPASQSNPVFEALREYWGLNKLNADVSSRRFAPTSAGMAEDYAALGIPGARYLDGRSRGAGAGTYNYTIYDPKIVEILKRYGLLPPVAGGAAAGASDGSQ